MAWGCGPGVRGEGRVLPSTQGLGHTAVAAPVLQRARTGIAAEVEEAAVSTASAPPPSEKEERRTQR